MTDLILTEAEIGRFVQYDVSTAESKVDTDDLIKAATNATLKAVVVWVDGDCPHHGIARRMCPECMYVFWHSLKAGKFPEG